MRESDGGVRQQRRLDRLARKTGERGADGRRVRALEKRPRGIDPMDAEIVEHEMVDVLEGRARRPGVVPVEHHVDRADLANQTGAQGVAHVGKIRCPAAVLIHRHLHPRIARQCDEALAGGEIAGKRFLAEDVFSGGHCLFDQLRAHLGMRGDVHHLDFRISQHLCDTRTNPRLRIEFFAAVFRSLGIRVIKRGHLPACSFVGLEVVFRDATAADQPDLRRGTLGRWRLIEKRRREQPRGARLRRKS